MRQQCIHKRTNIHPIPQDEPAYPPVYSERLSGYPREGCRAKFAQVEQCPKARRWNRQAHPVTVSQHITRLFSDLVIDSDITIANQPLEIGSRYPFRCVDKKAIETCPALTFLDVIDLRFVFHRGTPHLSAQLIPVNRSHTRISHAFQTNSGQR